LQLKGGTHDLRVEITDVNGNRPETPYIREFKVDTTGPYCYAHSISPLYDNIRGISEFNPSTLERAHHIGVSDDLSGVKSFQIIGPAENLVNESYDPPVVGLTITKDLTDMPIGDYEIRVEDGIGNKTVAKLKT